MGSLGLNIVLVAGLGIQVGVDIIAQLQLFLQTVFLDHDTFFFGFHDVFIADDAVSRLSVIMMKRCVDDVMHRYVM